MIKATHLDKTYNKRKSNELHVIDDFDRAFPETGMTAIFGRSGCGKTTLLNVLGGLDKPDYGFVEIDGERLTSSSDYLRNRYIGYIFQNYNLNKDKTVFDNVADILRLCGEKDAELIETRVKSALRSVGMENYAKRTPDALSGGQQQRIAIARAIVKTPRIILADEPTGNLDETNTLIVMDMLKEISKKCLVLLVTHEEKLVDYYCDNTILLSDGKVVGYKENTSANGLNARGKNDIYLGELEKSVSSSENLDVEYFGEKPDNKISIRLVNSGGQLYIKIDTPNVKVIDSSSEVCLKEGVFEEKKEIRENAFSFEALPALDAKNENDYGKLFGFKDSLLRGFSSLNVGKVRGKKFLRRLMGLFAVVIVIFSAIYGSTLKNYSDVISSYNTKSMLISARLDGVNDALLSSVDDENSGIDYFALYSLRGADDLSGSYMSFNPEYFISTTSSEIDLIFGRLDEEGMGLSAIMLPKTMMKSPKLLAGSTDGEGMWITKVVADEILKGSNYKFIENYSDLIGLIDDYSGERICAVIDTDERAAFYDEEYVFSSLNSEKNISNLVCGENVKDGEVVVAFGDSSGCSREYKVGDSVKISGKELKISEVVSMYSSYESWLEDKYPEVYNITFAFRNSGKFSDEYPEGEYGFRSLEFYKLLVNGEMGIAEALGLDLNELEGLEPEVALKEYPFAQTVYAYSHFDEWVEYCKENRYVFTQFYSSYEAACLYVFGYSDDAKYLAYGCADVSSYGLIPADIQNYYTYVKCKENTGKWPDPSAFGTDNFSYVYGKDIVLDSSISFNSGEYSLYTLSENIITTYKTKVDEIFKLEKAYLFVYPGSVSFKVSKNDYKIISVLLGETDRDVDYGYWYDYLDNKAGKSYVDYYYDNCDPYYIIHCTDVDKAYSYLADKLGEDVVNGDDTSVLLTQEEIKSLVLSENNLTVGGAIIPFAIIIALLALCVYFILRSTLMNRVKEIGIYRSIGVSKKNLRFEFMTETLSLMLLSVIPAFVLTSIVIFYAIGRSPMIDRFMFYPPWFALVMLAFTLGVCIVCGLIPINRLIRKTPAELIAKYDI